MTIRRKYDTYNNILFLLFVEPLLLGKSKMSKLIYMCRVQNTSITSHKSNKFIPWEFLVFYSELITEHNTCTPVKQDDSINQSINKVLIVWKEGFITCLLMWTVQDRQGCTAMGQPAQ